MFGTTGALLNGIGDADSATAALPMLETASSDLTAVAEEIAGAPEVAKGPLKTVILNGIAKVKPLAATVLTKEGVGDVIGPVHKSNAGGRWTD